MRDNVIYAILYSRVTDDTREGKRNLIDDKNGREERGKRGEEIKKNNTRIHGNDMYR